MSAILNTAEFDLNGETIILNELSALERFDYIEYVEQHQASDDDTLNQINKKAMLVSAYLVAISYARTTGTPRGEQHGEILNNWPPQLIGKAHDAVSELSGFVSVAQQDDDTADQENARQGKAPDADEPVEKKG